MLQVDLLSKNIVSVVECALVTNVPQLQALHPELKWDTAEMKDMLLAPQKLESFARSRNLDWQEPISESLGALVEGLRPSFAASQKECYGAVKVFVDLYADGKTLRISKDC